MARSFRIGRMALIMHGGEERGGQGTLGRLSVALLPARRPQPPPTAMVVQERSPADVARERARLALLDAQREMGGLLAAPTPSPLTPVEDGADHLSAQIAHLRTRLGDVESERGRLQSEVDQLRGALAAVTVRLDQLERRLDSPTASPADRSGSDEERGFSTASQVELGEPSGDAASQTEAASARQTPHAEASTERYVPIAQDEERALASRVFAAGNVGALVRVEPPPAAGVADLAARLASDPSVDHVEIQTAEVEVAVLRITFKLPCRWPALREILGRALGREIGPGEAGWAENALHLRPAAGTERG